MTNHEIEAFLAIVKHQNFSLAATNLFITQPALSRRLKNLEARLKCTLIDRGKGNKQISLTKEGELFLPIAARWLTLFKDSENLIQENLNQSLIISALDGIHTCVLTKPYKSFIQNQSAHTLKMMILSSKASYLHVEQEIVDLSFIAECQLSEKTTLIPMFSEKMFFVTASKQYKSNTINPASLDIRKCIYVQWNFETDAWYDSVFTQKTKPLAVVENMIVLGELLEGTDNWTIVPSSIAYYLEQTMDIYIKPLTKPLPDRTIYCIINSKTKKKELINSFLEHTNSYIKKIPNLKSLYQKD